MSKHSLLTEIRSLSDEELFEMFASTGVDTVAGVEFFLAELRHREQTKIAQNMERFTKQIRWLTVIILIATVVNSILVALTLWYS